MTAVVLTLGGDDIEDGVRASLGEGAAVVSLGAVDMEEGVQVRVQVDCEREKGRRGRETGQRQTRRDNKRTLKHLTPWMACGWSEMRTETP